MNNELGVLISGKIDVQKTVSQINSDLQSLTKSISALSLNVDTSSMTKDLQQQIQQVSKQVGGKNSPMSKAVMVDAESVKKHYGDRFKDILDITSQYGGKIQSVTQNMFKDAKGQESLKDIVATVRTAENEIKKITMYEDPDSGKLMEQWVTTIDNMGNVSEKTAQKFNSLQKSVTKDLQQISNSGKLTDEQIERFQRTIATTEDVQGLERIKQQLDNIRSASKIPDRGNVLGYDKSSLQKVQIGLQKLDGDTREHIQTVLQLQQEYRDLQVRAISVDQVSGRWSATLRKNAKENLELKGTIDRTNGSIYKQSEAIKQASASNLGFIEQFKIALSRVEHMFSAPYISDDIMQIR